MNADGVGGFCDPPSIHAATPRAQHYTEEEADRKMSRRFVSINLAKPMETVEQFPFVLCAWPSFADQPYITNYRIYDDRVGETT
ncbi:MAG: hypothetical protein QOF70_4143, partial [Acetobacteraceae bacterium]|nr:hypothetical protein [Acetobacteraceae bacterium]